MDDGTADIEDNGGQAKGSVKIFACSKYQPMEYEQPQVT